MPNTKDLTFDALKLKVLACGESGSGKTHFAGSFPKPLFFDFDGGMLTLRGRDIDYVDCADVIKNGVLVESAAEKCLSHLETLSRTDPQVFKTIVIDSISTFQESLLKYICKVNNIKTPQIKEWGMVIKGLQDLFMFLKSLDYHVVVTAHEQLIQDETTGEILFRPVIVGKKLPGQLPLYFDEVYRFVTEKDAKTNKTTYKMLTAAGTRYTAKSRLGVLDAEETPSFNAIMSKVRKEKGEKGV